MTLVNMAAMFGTMFALAIVPDASAFAVVARSMASGFAQGLVTTIGILVGDFVFIILAVCGLWAIAESMGSLFVLIKYLGGAYLIWLGIGLWRSKSKAVEIEGIKEFSWWSNFLCGLLITLGDPKAILFYVSILPAFLDLSSVSTFDTSMIMVITAITVGGVKLGYAYMADKARLLFKNSKVKERMNMTAGSVMASTGIFLVVRGLLQ